MPRQAKTKAEQSGPRGIQSATVALSILQAMVRNHGPMQLREIAEASQVDSSNAYRYLVSFGNGGLVTQGTDGRYELGPFAVELGLAAMARIDGLETASLGLSRLLDLTQADGHLSIWSNSGPVVARWRAGQPLSGVAMRVMEGTIMPMLTSSTGRTWAAFLPASITKSAVEAELAATPTSEPEREALKVRYQEQLAQIRKIGISRSQGERRAGIDALSGPIFDRYGRPIFIITLLGPAGGFDSDIEGACAGHLRDTLVSLTKALGGGFEVLSRYPWYQA